MIRALFAIAILVAPAYAQVAACARCHAKIAADFRKTGMGRSFYRMLPETFPEKPYYHEASDSYFAMIRTGRTRVPAALADWLRRQFDQRGREASRLRDGFGQPRQDLSAPHRSRHVAAVALGWYAEKGGSLAMNPGYDKPDYPGSTRPIHYECMACHNAYPKIPASNQEEGAEAQYLAPLPEGIDCQRCHGPGQEHIATSGAAAIVNPAKLPPDREAEVCLQCHLETSSRLLPHSIQRHGRKPFSYVAGQPLSDFLLAFDRAPGQNQAVEVASAPYRLRQSRCFLKSQGKLRCTTCHNPHDIPRGEAATAHYNKVCADCHAGSHRAGENCVGCHMPKTRTDDAVHIVITDHLIQRGIQRTPATADPAAEKTETHETPATSYRGPAVPYYPARDPAESPGTLDALYEAVAQVCNGSNLPAGLPLLAALIARERPAQAGFYVDLGEAYHSVGDLPQAVRAFEQALAQSPGSAAILLKLGNAQIESRLWAKAETVLRRATARSPSDPLAWGQLGWALWQQDKSAEGLAALQKSIALDAELPEMRNYLGQLLLGTGDRAGAEKQFREGVRLTPGIAEWRANLGGLLAALGKIPEARYQFEQAIRFKPEDASGHVGYARFLASQGEEPEAEKHAREAVQLDPALPGAHEMWGALLSNRNDIEGALRELQEAVKLEPGFARAQFELGAVLYSRGDVPAAVEHLRLASKGGYRDGDQFLKQIGK
jgi:predicted CXXCH cytochrome family protein